MDKVVRPGRILVGKRLESIFCEIRYNEGRLSIHGVVGPLKSGNCRGSYGQIIGSFQEYDERGYESLSDIEPAPGWDADTIRKFFDLWERWHLNDLKAGCEHQRVLGWGENSKVTIHNYRRSPLFHQMVSQATDGEMDAETYAAYCEVAGRVDDVLGYKGPKYPEHPIIATLLEYGFIEDGGTETKHANWVYPGEHPDGILTKPCPVCGYQYGSAWRTEEVPQEVIDWLFGLPDTDKTPAWA